MKSLPMLPLSSPHQLPRQPEPESHQQPRQPEPESRSPSPLKRLLRNGAKKGAKEGAKMLIKKGLSQVCCIIIQKVLLVLVVLGLLVGLAMLIAYLILKPKQLIYSVEAASIQHLAIGNQDDHINATFNYMIKSKNPEKHLSARYHSLLISTVHQSQSVAYIDMSSHFEQSSKSEKMIEAKLVSYKMALSKINAKVLRDEKSKGVIEMKVHITARVRYWKWIFRSRILKFTAVCAPIMIKIASSSNDEFKEVLCQTLP